MFMYAYRHFIYENRKKILLSAILSTADYTLFEFSLVDVELLHPPPPHPFLCRITVHTLLKKRKLKQFHSDFQIDYFISVVIFWPKILID